MKIVDNLLVLPIFIQRSNLRLKVLVLLAAHNNPIWQTIPSIHYSVSEIKLAQVIFKTSFENSQATINRLVKCILHCIVVQASSDRDCPMCLQRHLSNILKIFFRLSIRFRTLNPDLKP